MPFTSSHSSSGHNSVYSTLLNRLSISVRVIKSFLSSIFSYICSCCSITRSKKYSLSISGRIPPSGSGSSSSFQSRIHFFFSGSFPGDSPTASVTVHSPSVSSCACSRYSTYLSCTYPGARILIFPTNWNLCLLFPFPEDSPVYRRKHDCQIHQFLNSIKACVHISGFPCFKRFIHPDFRCFNPKGS